MQRVVPFDMELITYKQFGKLRMKQFVPKSRRVIELDGHEWMGGFWIAEGIGFTSVCRHEETPDEAGGLEIDFRELTEIRLMAIFEEIGLPLRLGMKLQEICSVLGEPERTDVFQASRKSYAFTVGKRHPYYVSATVHAKKGLIHIAVIRKDVLAKCDY